MAVINDTNDSHTLTGTTAADQINGNGGDDIIDARTRPTISGSGIDVVDGGTGTDTLVVNAGAETQAVQLFAGLSPSYQVRSNSGNFYVDAYNVELVNFTGGSGNDSINTGERGGAVNGGGGIDHWIANLGGLFSDVSFTLGTTTAIVGGGLTSILGIERINLTTGSGNDVIVGGAQADSITTGEGNDTIDAKTRPTATSDIDVVDGGDGTDRLIVNASAETQAVQLFAGFSPSFQVRSTSGNFYVDAYSIELISFTGGSGADSIDTSDRGGTINGGGGNDYWQANLGALTSAITFNLGVTTAIAAAGLTSISAIERIKLTTGSGSDIITGGALADSITTGNGDDLIDAKTRPAAGPDIDVVDGGNGNDMLVVNAAAESQAVQLFAGLSPSFQVRSTSGNFYLDAYNIEAISFTGGSGADSINTGNRGGTIAGGAGNDFWQADLSAITSAITFNLGVTTAIAAAGLTSISAIERIKLMTGSGNDVVIGGALADSITTGNGDDLIDAKTRPTAAPDIDVVDGGAGTDTLTVNGAAETQAMQLSTGFSPSFQVRSTSGNFYVDAYNVEVVRFTSGSGADTINTGNRGGTVDGGGAVDHWLADLSALASSVTFTLGATTSIAAAGLTSILNLERITLTTGSGNDSIVGGAQADSVTTGNGNDTVDAKTRPTVAGSGIDVVDGGLGTDKLVVNGAAETLAMQLSTGFSPSYQVRSASGNFYVDAYNFEQVAFTGGAGADTINTGARGGTVDGGGGIDHWIADLSALTSAVSFNIGAAAAITAAGLNLIQNIERITLTTGSGNDVIVTGAQADTISTGNGDDTIYPRTRPVTGGIDVVDGGGGNDRLNISAAAETQAVQLYSGSSPSFQVRSTSGNHAVDAYNVEAVTLTSGGGNDNLTGGAGADSFNTAGGNDILNGGGGPDVLVGGAGLDTLRGGAGADQLTGGADADLFDYDKVTESGVASGTVDTITDFQTGIDKLDVSTIDANNLSFDGNQAFIFIGAAGFHGVRGELRASGGVVEADVTGDGIADFRVFAAAAAAADFIL